MHVSLMVSGLKSPDIYKKSLESIEENLLSCNQITSFDIYEYIEEINFDNKYIKYDGGPTGVRTNTIQPMFYKILMCNKQINKKYDACIRSRFDFILNSKVNLLDIDLTKYNIPNYGTVKKQNGSLISVCDFFCISNQKNMNYYCDIYNNLDEMFATAEYKNPECLLSTYLGEENISLLDIDHCIMRQDGCCGRFWQGHVVM